MEADVVVIGGGGSGLAAAIGAAESGASVVLLEKNAALGGTTALSIGSISAAGTQYQKRLGIVDTGSLSGSASGSAHKSSTSEQIEVPAHAPLGAGPYYALGPAKLYMNFTDGGLAVDEHLRVLGPQARPIPGLYAAGSAGQGGLLLKGHGHHLGWAFTSGRLAGRYAAHAEAAMQAPSPVRAREHA